MPVIAPVDPDLFVRVLEADGWTNVKRRNELVVLAREDNPRVLVINTLWEIAPDVLEAHLANAGMTFPRYIELLNKLRGIP